MCVNVKTEACTNIELSLNQLCTSSNKPQDSLIIQSELLPLSAAESSDTHRRLSSINIMNRHYANKPSE